MKAQKTEIRFRRSWSRCGYLATTWSPFDGGGGPLWLCEDFRKFYEFPGNRFWLMTACSRPKGRGFAVYTLRLYAGGVRIGDAGRSVVTSRAGRYLAAAVRAGSRYIWIEY